MTRAFEVTEDEYRVIEEAAHERGLAPDALFRAWVASVRHHVEDGGEIDPDQAWFWTPEWQAKEREADDAIASGKGTFYDSAEAFLASLDDE